MINLLYLNFQQTMNCYNDWYEISKNMDDEYDTFQNIIIPNIYNLLDEEYDIIEMKKNIDDYCVDDYYNMDFKDFCRNCVLHEPQCVCE